MRSLQHSRITLKLSSRCNAQERVGEKTIVFLMTCASVDFFSKVLSRLEGVKELSLKVEGLHGRMVQKRRTAVGWVALVWLGVV